MRKTSVRVLRYFNPLPPCGGRRYRWICASFLLYISIHSLRVEGDRCLFPASFNPGLFQSTPSVWRETLLYLDLDAEKRISIHSLRVEGDWILWHCCTLCRVISIHSLRVEGDAPGCVRQERHPVHFNPLPPCGGRRHGKWNCQCSCGFQSTPSVWRETFAILCLQIPCYYFNPLPPCGGRRQVNNKHSLAPRDFNPLPPCGGRHAGDIDRKKRS